MAFTLGPARRAAALAALLMIATALAGCHGLDDGSDGASLDPPAGDDDGDGAPVEPPGDDDGENGGDDDGANGGDDDGDNGGDDDGDNGGDNGNGDDPPTRHQLTLTVTDPPTQKIEDEASEITVDVSGDEVEATTAGLRWATASTAGTDEADLTPDDLPGSKNAAGSSFAFPGDYEVTGWALDAGTYYVRAHVVVDDLHYWSDEFEVQVVAEIEEGSFSADTTITIATDVLAPCSGDNWSDDETTISVGDVIKWRNNANCPHTATSGSAFGEPDSKFDTGQLQSSGGESASFRFNKAGTYEYYCANHSGMTVATIVVS